jgi:succinoglycan biosynthesis transport protein ExoP
MSKDSQGGCGQQMEQLQSRLIEARTRRAEIEATYKIIKRHPMGGDLASQPAVLNSGQVADAKRQTTEAARKLAEVSQRYGKEHPKYLQAESDAKSANENLQRQIELVVGGINQRVRAGPQHREDARRHAWPSARGSVQSVNRKEFALGRVRARGRVQQADVRHVHQARQRDQRGGDLQTTVARVVDAAALPVYADQAEKVHDCGRGAVVGLLVGSCWRCCLKCWTTRSRTRKTSKNASSSPAHHHAHGPRRMPSARSAAAL